MLAHKNIVIVDDSLDNCLLLERYLAKEGYKNVSHVLCAEDVLLRLQGETIDLILMDILMPTMDGIEAVRLIRKIHNYTLLPIIMVSAADQTHYLNKAFLAGANDYIAKPVKRIELLARIKVALELKKQYEDRLHYETILEETLKKQQKEIDLAKNIQASLLPDRYKDSDIEMIGSVIISENLSGDFYYWHKKSDSQYAAILIDVMGHGISSAFVGMTIRSILPDIIHSHQHPADAISQLNRHMIELYSSYNDQLDGDEYYFTATYLLIDTEAQTLRYVNAAHPPALVFTHDQQILTLDTINSPIGMFADIDFTEGEIPFCRGDRIFLYSDGFLEALLKQEGATNLDLLQWTQRRNLSSLEHTMKNFIEPAITDKENNEDDVSLLLVHFSK